MDTLDAISAWFDEAGTASMELPGGWFGRPYDNLHRLTWSTVRDNKIFLELDTQLHLFLADVEIVEVAERELVLQCRQLVFDWREYGSSQRRHAEVHENGGLLKFYS